MLASSQLETSLRDTRGCADRHSVGDSSSFLLSRDVAHLECGLGKRHPRGCRDSANHRRCRRITIATRAHPDAMTEIICCCGVACCFSSQWTKDQVNPRPCHSPSSTSLHLIKPIPLFRQELVYGPHIHPLHARRYLHSDLLFIGFLCTMKNNGQRNAVWYDNAAEAHQFVAFERGKRLEGYSFAEDVDKNMEHGFSMDVRSKEGIVAAKGR